MGQNSRIDRNKRRRCHHPDQVNALRTQSIHLLEGAVSFCMFLHLFFCVFPRRTRLVLPTPLALPLACLSIQLLLIFIFLQSAFICLFSPPRTTTPPPLPLTPPATELEKRFVLQIPDVKRALGLVLPGRAFENRHYNCRSNHHFPSRAAVLTPCKWRGNVF